MADTLEDFFLEQPQSADVVPAGQEKKFQTGAGVSVLQEARRTDGTIPDVTLYPRTHVKADDTTFTKPLAESERYGPFTGALMSTLSAAGPEFFFMDPIAGVEEYRTEYPKIGLATSIIGEIGSFAATLPIAGAGAARLPFLAARGAKATKYGLQLARVEKMQSGFARSALQAGIQMAPVEAVKLGTGAVSALATGEPEKMVDQSKRVLMDMAVGAGVVGGVGFAASRFPLSRTLIKGEEQVQRTIGKYNLGDAPQFKIQQIHGLRNGPRWENLDANTQRAANDTLQGLMKEVRSQVATGKETHVRDLTGGKRERVESYFKPSGQKGSHVTTYLAGEEGELTKEAQKYAIKDPELLRKARDLFLRRRPPEHDAVTQYERFIVAESDEGASSVAKMVRENFAHGTIAKNTWMGKEADETGHFLLAIREGKTTPTGGAIARKGDIWWMFKTPNPGLYHPDAATYGAAINQHSFHLAPAALSKTLMNVPLVKEVTKLAEETYPIDIAKGTETYGPGGRLVKMLGPETAANVVAARETASTIGRKVLAPQERIFAHSPGGARVWQIMRRTYEKGREMANGLMYGEVEEIPSHANIFGRLLRGKTSRVGGALPHLDRATAAHETAMDEITAAIHTGMTPDDAAALGFHPEVVRALREFSDIELKLGAQTEDVVRAVQGEGKFSALLGQGRRFRGTYRIPIRDEKGRIASYGSGVGNKDATKEAQGIVDMMAEKGVKLKFDPNELKGSMGSDMDLAQTITSEHAADVGRTLAKKTLEGKSPLVSLTAKEYADNTLAHWQRLYNVQAEHSLRGIVLEKELARLKNDAPEVLSAIDRGFLIAGGGRTEFGRIQDKAADAILGPVLGPNSASKLVDTFNAATFQLTLGMLDVGFPAMNAMTWVQTVLPEVAYVLNPTDAARSQYHQLIPFVGKQSGRGVLAAFDPLKLSYRAMKTAAGKGGADEADFAEYIRRAISDGTISPRFTEETVGAAHHEIVGAAKAGDWLDMIKGISSWMPGRTEEFSRTHAFAVGYHLAKMGGKNIDEGGYELAKKFTERTMYNYGTIDRAAFTTTPMGRMFGMFKTWSNNYLWNMGDYAKAGFKENNWAPFMWMMAGTGSVAGATGMPLFFVADGMSRVLNDKGVVQNLYSWMDDDTAADMIAYGPLAMFGYTTGGRGDAPSHDMVRDANAMAGVASWRRVQEAWKLFGEVKDRWQYFGEHPSTNKRVYDQFALTFLPRTGQRFMQVVGQEGVRSLQTGNAITAKMDLKDKIIYTATDFEPVDMRKMFFVKNEIFQKEEERKRAVTVMGSELADGWHTQDPIKTDRAIRRAIESAMFPSVVRSAQRHLQGLKTPPLEKIRDPKLQQIRRDILGK